MKTITNLNINELTVKTLSDLASEKFTETKELSIKLDKVWHRRLKTLAFNLDTSMSEIVRSFLEQFCEQYQKENVIEVQHEVDNRSVL